MGTKRLDHEFLKLIGLLMSFAVLFVGPVEAAPKSSSGKVSNLVAACDSGPPPRSLCLSAGCASALVAQSRPQTPILRAATGTTPPSGSGALATCNASYKTGSKEWECCLDGIKRGCKTRCTAPTGGNICPLGTGNKCNNACTKGCEARCGTGAGC